MLTSIVGINWGDEGKGRMVDLLSQKYDVVVRYQGGNNAGHTVINDKGKFVLNLMPSGILRDETVNVLGPGMVIDTEHMFHEVERLRAGGITVNSHRFTITGGSGGTTVSVNGASVSAGSLWAVGGSEKVSSVSVGGAYAITGSGLQQVETQQQQDTSGVYVIAGTGMGHNIGMSQWGAYAMAQKGFTAEEIIRFYYTGVTVDYYDPN